MKTFVLILVFFGSGAASGVNVGAFHDRDRCEARGAALAARVDAQHHTQNTTPFCIQVDEPAPIAPPAIGAALVP
jgi:hypothetical protein